MIHNEIPKELLNDFSMNGKCKIVYDVIDNSTEEFQIEINKKFNKKEFDDCLSKISNRLSNYYGPTDIWLYNYLDKIGVKNKKCLIIGSTYPWYESIMYYYGCSEIIVSEYNDRDSINEKIKYIKPDELEKYKNYFDICINISSIEHDGLGRYGDPLNPNGDFESIKKIKEYLKENVIMVLSVPVGFDTVIFNKHRIYGQERLPLLLKEWELIDSIGYYPDRELIRNGNIYENNNEDYIIYTEFGYLSTSGYYQPIFILRNNKC